MKLGRDREARFGLMFKRLPAYNPTDALLTALAVKMNDGKAPLNDARARCGGGALSGGSPSLPSCRRDPQEDR